MDLTISQTILNFTNLNFILSHGGGAFPAIEDRFITSFPIIEGPSKAVYKSRFFYDSAGPVYFNQIKGLLVYNISTSQLTFGTDFPYAPPFAYATSIEAIVNATFLSMSDKQRIFASNAEELSGGLIDMLALDRKVRSLQIQYSRNGLLVITSEGTVMRSFSS